MPHYIHELRFCFDPSQRREFVRGKLGPTCMKHYPKLFDADDWRI